MDGDQPGAPAPGRADALPLGELLEQVRDRFSDVVGAQERLRGLLDAVVTLAADLSLDSVLQRIVSAASDLAGARYGALGVLADPRPGSDQRLREFVTHGITPQERAVIGAQPRGRGLLGLIIDRPEPVRLERLGEHPAAFGFPPNHPRMSSFLGVPVRIRDTVFGNLYLTEKHGGGPFTPEDEQVVVALAAAAGVVIENARLYEEGARRERWLAAAAEITKALLGEADRRTALQLVADRARDVAGANVAGVLLREEDGDDLVVAVVSGRPAEAVLGAAVSSSSDGDGFRRALALPEAGPVVELPLRIVRTVVGVLVLAWEHDDERSFLEIPAALAESFAEQAALCLQVARAREDRARLAVFEDRDRIGRDLHDLVIQRLFAVGLTLQNVGRLSAPPEVTERVEGAVDELDATIREIRRTIFELATGRAEAAGLREELGRVVAEQSAHLGFRPRVTTEGPLDSTVPDEVRPHLLAVLREAVSNAARHSGAHELDIRCSAGADLVLTVTDDGRGMAHAGPFSGLRNMRQRARRLGGSFEIGTPETGGTRLVWRVPLG